MLFSKRIMTIVYAFSILFHNLILGIIDKEGFLMDETPKSISNNDRRDDSFHKFMFGDRGIEVKEETEEDQKHTKSTEDLPEEGNHFSRDDWFLGRRNHTMVKENRQHANLQIEELFKNVNMDELLNNIDNLFNSISHIKPLWRKMGPFINKWMKQ
jgi:hypothetical protein